MLRRTVLTLRASTPALLKVERVKPFLIKATGHGNRQMCQTDKNGFVRREVVHVIALQGSQASIEPVVPSTVP